MCSPTLRKFFADIRFFTNITRAVRHDRPPYLMIYFLPWPCIFQSCPLLCIYKTKIDILRCITCKSKRINYVIDEQLVLGFLESVPKFVSYLFSFSFRIHLDYRSRTRILKNYVRLFSFKIEIRLKTFQNGNLHETRNDST